MTTCDGSIVDDAGPSPRGSSRGPRRPDVIKINEASLSLSPRFSRALLS